MTYLILPSVRQSQPVQTVNLAPDGLGSKAYFAYSGGSPNRLDLATRHGIIVAEATGTPCTGLSYKSMPAGAATSFHPEGGIYGVGGINTKTIVAQDFSALWIGYHNIISGGNSSLWNRGLGNDSVRISYGGTSEYIDSGGTTTTANIAGLSPVQDRFEMRMLTKEGTTLKQYDWRTMLTATSTGGNGVIRDDGSNNYFYLNHRYSGTSGVQLAVLFAVFDPLSDAEVYELFKNPWQIFSPISRTLYLSTAGNVTLTPSLYTASHTFYTPTVTRGSVELTPSLYTASHTFYGPTVQATYGLTPSLFTPTHTFYEPTVTRGAVTLTPALYTAAHTFYAPTVANTSGTQSLTPELYSVSHTFYAATVTRGSVGLTPALYTSAHTFYAPVVTPGAVALTPSLYTASHSFYAPVVSPGVVPLTPSLYTAAHTFYGPTVTGGAAAQALTAGLYTATHTFYAHVVTPGSVTITAGLYSSTHEFYLPKVTRAGDVTDLTWIDLHPDQAPYISGLIGGGETKKKKRRGLDHASPVQDLPYSTGSGKIPTGGGGFSAAVVDAESNDTKTEAFEIIRMSKPTGQPELHAITPDEMMLDEDDIMALLLLL